MKLLIPLGLLGLLGLLVLILIYILKPNFQQKIVSSTYVWKLSLKYKKKRVPISRLRNILILICQILIICAAALILSYPAIVTDNSVSYQEKILIIDASANMLAEQDGTQRFERAVGLAKDEIEDVFAADGLVTVIVAGRQASYLFSQRVSKTESNELYSALEQLECTYGTGDVEGAMTLAEETLYFNPEAEVIFYTGTHYDNPGKNLTVTYVTEEEEWNAAILGATATLEDGYYTFEVQIACYGSADREIEVLCEATNVNGGVGVHSLPEASVKTYDEETFTIIYSVDANADGYNSVAVSLSKDKIYSFDELYIRLNVSDSLSIDNEYYIYGANRPTIKVEYYTTTSNPFYPAILMAIAEDKNMKARWDIQIKEVRSGEPEIEGYDFYIFEGTMPKSLPTDGVVFMADPDASLNAGFTLGSKVTVPNWSGDGASLAPGVEHPIMDYVNIESFALTSYTKIEENSLDGYEVLMYYEGNPVFFVRNEANSKIVVAAYSVRTSTLNINYNFIIMMVNVFNYYFPSTFSDSIYTCYDTVQLTPRGSELTVIHNDNVVLGGSDSETEIDFAELQVNDYGTYVVRQTLISGAVVNEKFYVTIPAAESNITKTEAALTNLYKAEVDEFSYEDLLVYFAATLVGLLFLERLLQSREGL